MSVKTPKYVKEIERVYQTVLSGSLLAIDPSTGSHSSMPGYAVFKKGELVESGIIQVNPADLRNQKLYSITKSLREEFETPDVLAVENIPPIQYNRGSRMSGWSIAAIQRALGAIISVYNCEYVEIAPKAWQKFKPADYVKSDEWDAIAIGLCVIKTAEVIRDKKEPSNDMAMGKGGPSD